MRRILKLVVLCASVASLARAQDAPASRTADYAQVLGGPSGTLVVRTTFKGEAPASRPIVVPAGLRERAPADAAFCDGCAAEGRFFDESLLVDPTTKGVRNVAVALRRVTEGARTPLPRTTVDNRGALFAPRVSFAPVEEPLILKNSDPIPHAAALSDFNGHLLCNVSLPPAAEALSPRLLATGIYAVACPLHPWMRATVVAVRHPYVATTDARGVATIDLIPPGKHGVTIWHETLGTATRTVAIVANEVVEIELTSADFVPPK